MQKIKLTSPPLSRSINRKLFRRADYTIALANEILHEKQRANLKDMSLSNISKEELEKMIVNASRIKYMKKGEL